MAELASTQPGFLGMESVRGGDGFGITLSYWATRRRSPRGASTPSIARSANTVARTGTTISSAHRAVERAYSRKADA